VHLAGLRTDQAPLWQLSEHCGLVFQNPAGQMLASRVKDEVIFGLENLGLAPGEIDRRVDEALQQFGLAELRNRSPQTLSGGEQQKLALATITARRTDGLVLDEPLSMLDPTAAFELVAHLETLASQGSFIIICEHRCEFLDSVSGLRTFDMSNTAHAGRPLADLEWPAMHDQHFTLVIRDLCVQRAGRRILEAMNLEIPAGQVTALVGQNGVGKTTLLRTLVGLQSYTGQVQVDCGMQPLRPDFGMVFQNPDLQLFNASVRAEILYGVKDADLNFYHKIIQALDLDAYEDTPPLLLSEGEKRRLALAMTLMRRPAHGILLDEPALGQDAAHKAVLMRLLHLVAGAGQIVLFSTHDIELAARADTLILLGKEGILDMGAPRQVLENSAAWQRAGLRIPPWVKP
jgi:energy-coupling factor transporter ATP-binding protein EcfA2